MDLSQNITRFARQHTTVFLCVAITITWILLLSILLVCQLSGAPFGLNIHATGEDRVWTDLLDKGGFTTHRSWWALASRNPLGPWWYDATTPLLWIHPSGLYLSKRFVELFVAISSALVLFELFDRKKLWLSYGMGVLVLAWNFSGYIEQILFVMLIALGFSLFCLYSYLRYLKSQRTNVEWLLLSLASYFVALGTYTIQCGVPLAILLCSLAYGDKALAPNSKTSSWFRSWYDTFYFGTVFVLFSMVWITTSGPTSSFFKVNAALISQNALTSIANMLWHQDTVDLTRSMLQTWSTTSMVIVFTLSLLTIAYVMRWLQKRDAEIAPTNLAVAIQWKPYVVLFGVAMSIAIPTFALEAMSSLWYPGSRSRMIQQAFQPIFYMAILFGVVSTVQGMKKVPYLTECAMLVLIAFGSLLGFEYNRRLVELSSYERNLVAGLKQLVPEVVRPTKFIVRLENDNWYGGRNAELNRILVKQSFGSDLVSLDAIYKGAPDPVASVKVAEDQVGVFCPSANKFVPFTDVFFATFDGKNVTPLTVIDAETFAGYQLGFDRKSSHRSDRLANMRPSGDRVEFQFELNPPGTGWSAPESSPTGETFVWMCAKTASFEFFRFADTPVRLRFKTLQPISPEIRDSLKITVKGKEVPVRVVDTTDNKWTYEAELPTAPIDEIALLKFNVDRTMPPPGTNRELAIPFDWVEFKHDCDNQARLSETPQEETKR